MTDIGLGVIGELFTQYGGAVIELAKVAKKLNQRPGKTLGFKTPADRLNECIAMTS